MLAVTLHFNKVEGFAESNRREIDYSFYPAKNGFGDKIRFLWKFVLVRIDDNTTRVRVNGSRVD